MLLALLAALAVFAHHELSDSPLRPSPGAMPGMSMNAVTAAPDGPGVARAVAVTTPAESPPGADHGTGAPPCSMAGQMCASGALGGHFVPVVPAGLDLPLPQSSAPASWVADSMIDLGDSPGLTGILRI
ncbi:MAG TPA: hypothetical protein VFN97_21810 [Actinospica sp.]|nr:hypothetical protein [Actinospica sp.]